MNDISVLLVDDYFIVRKGMRSMLTTVPGITVVGEAEDGSDALPLVESLRPTVVLMDVRMLRLDGIETTRRLKATNPETSVIIMTSMEDDTLVIEAVCAGASGFMLKDASSDELIGTIRAVANGDTLIRADLLRKAIQSQLGSPRPAGMATPKENLAEQLSEREHAVLLLVTEGLTNREIGEKLFIAEVTAKKHVQAIIAKLHASDRTHAAITAIRTGLID